MNSGANLFELRFPVNFRLQQSPFVKTVLEGNGHAAEAIFHAAAEVDGGGFREIFRRTGDLGNFVTGIHNLRKHLVVEHKIVGVGLVVDGLNDLFRKRAVTGVIFREFLIDQNVLSKRQATVENVLVHGHSSTQRAFAENAGTEYHREHIIGNEVRHGMNELRRVLVIGMQHDDNVRTDFQRFVVARFLVAAVSLVLLVADDVVNAQLLPYLNGTVAAGIVHEHHFIYNFKRNFFIRFTQSEFRVVGRQNNDEFFSENHGANITEVNSWAVGQSAVGRKVVQFLLTAYRPTELLPTFVR